MLSRCLGCDQDACFEQLTPSAQAAFPSCFWLCLSCLREDIAALADMDKPETNRVPAAPLKRNNHPAYKGNPPPTCYGDAGKCPNIGELYAGGIYCGELGGHYPGKSPLDRTVISVLQCADE